MTTSTSLSLFVMARSLAHVSDADRLVGERFAAKFSDMVVMNRYHARKTNDGPAGFVAVAAIDRIGIHALDHGLIKCRPEHPHRQSVFEFEFCGGKSDQNIFALRC